MRNLRLTDVVAPFVLAQGFAYLVVAPFVVALSTGSEAQYFPIIGKALLLFLLPLTFFLYMPEKAPARPIVNVAVNRLRLRVSALLIVLYEVLYWHTALSLDLLTRRIGTEQVAEVFAGLGVGDLVILRSHDILVLVLPALLSIVAVRARGRSERMLGWGLAGVTFASFVLHTFLNSRLQFVIGIVLLAAVLLQARPVRLSGRKFLVVAAAACVVLYALAVISNLRAAVATGQELTLSVLMPGVLQDSPAVESVGMSEWVHRLDCVDLIARMEPSLDRHGLEWGAAWRTPIFMLFGGLTDPSEYEAIKGDAVTTAKAYLLQRHTDLSFLDYYSCALTDAYGNFGSLGMLFAAFYFGGAVTLVTRMLRSSSPLLLVLGVFAAFHVLSFESEFISHVVGWARLLPFVLVVALLNPVIRIDRSA